MRRLFGLFVLLVVAGCTPALSPQQLAQYQGRTLYTCCNMHYEGENLSDANYYVGALLPFGSAAQVEGSGRGTVIFTANGTKFYLAHSYGAAQESFEQYLNKVLVPEDPKARFATFSPSVQAAIQESRVEKGMTREQVIMSIGYPPTHQTPDLNATQWRYWYNRWVTYIVEFDANGFVSNIIGTTAPTHNSPVTQALPAPATPSKRAPTKRPVRRPTPSKQ